MVTKLNIFKDNAGLLRVKAKFKRWHTSSDYPILLPKNSKITVLVVEEIHRKLRHAGIYNVLSELRKSYYVPSHYSVVKKIINNCSHCARFNNRAVKLNQNSYRDWRVMPPNVPFKYIFVDFFGPYSVHKDEEIFKVYVLCITCLWSRAVELRVCNNLTVEEFLKKLHYTYLDMVCLKNAFQIWGLT